MAHSYAANLLRERRRWGEEENIGERRKQGDGGVGWGGG